MKNFQQDETFKNRDYTSKDKVCAEYDTCYFINCDFSAINLSAVVFSECVFESCNLSSAKINNTSFQQVVFKSCKMLGLQFDECNEFGLDVNFENCLLNHSSFYKSNIPKTTFLDCQLKEVDFTETNLSQSEFNNCDLSLALFERTNLNKSNFQSAINFSIDPTKNTLKKAKFSFINIKGLLDSFDIEIIS